MSKDSKQMLEVEFRNLRRLYNYIKNNEEGEKYLRMFSLFNLSSKLEYKALEIGEIDLIYEVSDFQAKIIDFIIRSLRRKQE